MRQWKIADMCLHNDTDLGRRNYKKQVLADRRFVDSQETSRKTEIDVLLLNFFDNS